MTYDKQRAITDKDGLEILGDDGLEKSYEIIKYLKFVRMHGNGKHKYDNIGN